MAQERKEYSGNDWFFDICGWTIHPELGRWVHTNSNPCQLRRCAHSQCQLHLENGHCLLEGKIMAQATDASLWMHIPHSLKLKIKKNIWIIITNLVNNIYKKIMFNINTTRSWNRLFYTKDISKFIISSVYKQTFWTIFHLAVIHTCMSICVSIFRIISQIKPERVVQKQTQKQPYVNTIQPF